MSECRCLLVAPERLPDEMLWSMVTNGRKDVCEGAFDEILKRYLKLVRHIVWRILRNVVNNHSDLDDAVQNVFLEVFRARHKFDASRGSFKVWLVGYAYTRTFNYLRALVRTEIHSAHPVDGAYESHLDKRIWARELFAMLNTRQKQAVKLVALAGFTLEEAARAMGHTLAATRHYCYKGLAKLRATEAVK
jgi:RNA polymerase sigma-70 factor (ECF subfamily)